MKTTMILAGMMLIMLAQCGCRTSRSSNRHLNRLETFDETNIQSNEQENKLYSHSYSISDSSAEVYQVTIFPLDTFQFTLKEGFTGKASKIELRGSIRHLRQMYDSTTLIVSEDRATNRKVIRKMETKQLEKARSVEKANFKWWELFLALAAAVLIYWLYRRSGKTEFW